MALVEECDDPVARLEACDGATNGLDDTGTVRARNNIVFLREGVATLGNDEIAIVQGRSVD